MAYGKVWKYGNNINTDIISPPFSLELPIKEAAKFTMQAVDPDFAANFRKGDVFVAEHNLGSGSSRENAPLMLRELGVKIVVAMDYARIFYRNCINVGIIPIECADTPKISKGDMIEVDYGKGVIRNQTTGEEYPCSKMPPHIEAIIDAGGLIPYIENVRLKKQ
jgi:3-isopropylmalate/(R)-2-methylmalate dehydratase small subunit